MDMPEFKAFPKIARLSRDIIITEKIDGTNALVYIGPKHPEVLDDPELVVYAGSRNQWITPASDNFGFAQWVFKHQDELKVLGPGAHYGEWWGAGIQRRYGLQEKRFSLFHVRKGTVKPDCCHVVPQVYVGPFSESAIQWAMGELRAKGSFAAPGFMKPEGIVIFHSASGTLFKKTFEGDANGKESA